MYGFGTTPHGAPTDGWRRENSFVPPTLWERSATASTPFNPTVGGYQYPAGQTAIRGPGIGTRHRISAEGPGVTMEVSWEGAALGSFASASAGRQPESNQMTVIHSLADKSGLVGHS